MLNVWHGSLTPGILKFRPGSHFGSKLQACACIAAHAALDGHRGLPTLYRCTLDFQEHELYRLDDWKSPRMQGLLWAYCLATGAKMRYLSEHLPAVQDLEPAENAKRCTELVIDEMSRHGHMSVSYVNQVEAKEISYCVVFPQRVKVEEETRVTYAEIAEALSAPAGNNHGYSEKERQAIAAFLSSQMA